MSATKVKLEQRSLELQALAQKVLQGEVKIADVANSATAMVFDRDLSEIVTTLYMHNNLSPEKAKVKPVTLIEHIIKQLGLRGYNLTQTINRLDHIRASTGGSFQHPDGGMQFLKDTPLPMNSIALDRPLRSLREKMYEVGMHEGETPSVDSEGAIPGKKLLQTVDSLITVVKKLEAGGDPYLVSEDAARATKGRTEHADAQYDALAAKLNKAVGSDPKAGAEIEALYLEARGAYVVKEEQVPTLHEIVSEVLEGQRRVLEQKTTFAPEGHDLSEYSDWSPGEKYVKVDDLAPLQYEHSYSVKIEDPEQRSEFLETLHEIKDDQETDYQVIEHANGAISVASPDKDFAAAVVEDTLPEGMSIENAVYSDAHINEDKAKERSRLMEFAIPSTNDEPIVRLVSLPFDPYEIDDNYPTLELHQDKFITDRMIEVTIREIGELRYSGFVLFEQHYRMQIVWATAGEEEEKGGEGQTYKDIILETLNDFKNKFEFLGMVPEVVEIKVGGAYYFPRPISLPRLVASFARLRAQIAEINDHLVNQEITHGVRRYFNRTLSNDELPGSMELS